MRIAILSPFYPYRGGIAQFSNMLYQAFEQNHDVKAFSFKRLYPGILFPGKSQYVEIEDPANHLHAERILDSINPFSYQKTANKIREFDPDFLIIAYWMSFFGPAYGHVASRLKGKTKIISLLHNAIPHEPKFFDKPFAKLLFDRSDGFVVMSEAVKNDLYQIRPNAKYCQIPHPLYNHFGEILDQKQSQASLGLDPSKKTLLFFGLIREYKGLDLLISAMSNLDESYQLIIAGECYGSFDKYEELINQSPAKGRIIVMNHYISDNQVPVLFSAADLLVLPYKSATQSGVIPAAYHFNTPILATDVGGLKETLEPPGTGRICMPDPQSIAQGVDSIFSTGKDTFISNIKKEKQTLSWENFSDSIIQFFQTLS